MSRLTVSVSQQSSSASIDRCLVLKELEWSSQTHLVAFLHNWTQTCCIYSCSKWSCTTCNFLITSKMRSHLIIYYLCFATANKPSVHGEHCVHWSNAFDLLIHKSQQRYNTNTSDDTIQQLVEVVYISCSQTALVSSIYKHCHNYEWHRRT